MRTIAVATLAVLASVPATASEAGRCFSSSASQNQSFVVLSADGTYRRGELEPDGPGWLDHGTYSSTAATEFELRSDSDAWTVETPHLSVSPYRLFNVELVPDLREKLLGILDAHPKQQRFSYEELNSVVVKGHSCPEADWFVCMGPCSGPRYYGVYAFAKTESVTRRQLVRLLDLLERYVHRSDLHVFHMHIFHDSGFTVAYFDRSDAGYAFRAASRSEIKSDLRLWRELEDSYGDTTPTAPLVEVDCTSLMSSLQPLLQTNVARATSTGCSPPS